MSRPTKKMKTECGVFCDHVAFDNEEQKAAYQYMASHYQWLSEDDKQDKLKAAEKMWQMYTDGTLGSLDPRQRENCREYEDTLDDVPYPKGKRICLDKSATEATPCETSDATSGPKTLTFPSKSSDFSGPSDLPDSMYRSKSYGNVSGQDGVSVGAFDKSVADSAADQKQGWGLDNSTAGWGNGASGPGWGTSSWNSWSDPN